MSRETKRPRITRPTENRDENRRGRTQNFEDLAVLTQSGLTVNVDIMVSVI